MMLAVTIDTEADNQWQGGCPVTTRNAAYWAPFQDLCDRHGISPTYLVATEIVEDERARQLLSAWSRRGAEIGAHLHPWTTPPFADRPGLRYNDPAHVYPSQLPDDLLHEKTSVLTAQIASAFGSSPTSYRAGRFGIDTRGATLLAEAGSTVDSSVTPLWSWRRHPGLDGTGGPDFRTHSPQPFLIEGRGAHRLLEIPVTIMATYRPLRSVPLLLDAYQWLPVRAARKLLLSRWLSHQPVCLSPGPRYLTEDLVSVWRCAADAGLDAAVLIFHSSELMPGGSPFLLDAPAVRGLLDCLDAFFSFVREEGGRFLTLSALAAAVLANGTPETRAL